jgi:hypothetical protein
MSFKHRYAYQSNLSTRLDVMYYDNTQASLNKPQTRVFDFSNHERHQAKAVARKRDLVSWLLSVIQCTWFLSVQWSSKKPTYVVTGKQIWTDNVLVFENKTNKPISRLARLRLCEKCVFIASRSRGFDATVFCWYCTYHAGTVPMYCTYEIAPWCSLHSFCEMHKRKIQHFSESAVRAWGNGRKFIGI